MMLFAWADAVVTLPSRIGQPAVKMTGAGSGKLETMERLNRCRFEFMSETPLYTEAVVTHKQSSIVDDGGSLIALTPDDILTLKLLRDSYQNGWHFRNTESNRGGRRDTNSELTLETLNRILKQVG